MSKIELIPLLDACNFPDEVEAEFIEHEVSTHYQHDLVFTDWDDGFYPEFKKWAVEFYGDEIKKYNRFAIAAT